MYISVRYVYVPFHTFPTFDQIGFLFCSCTRNEIARARASANKFSRIFALLNDQCYATGDIAFCDLIAYTEKIVNSELYRNDRKKKIIPACYERRKSQPCTSRRRAFVIYSRRYIEINENTPKCNITRMWLCKCANEKNKRINC